MVCRVQGIDIFYEKSGAGVPLIMLHGNGETHEIFDKAVPILAEHFTVYALDSRGHGQSSAVSKYHYMDMVQDVRCFIKALKLENPVLYGFSDGGIVGLLLASLYPQTLRQLIISGANTQPEALTGCWLTVFKILYFFTRDKKMKMMIDEPYISGEMLQKIVVPTTVLAGSKDLVKQSNTEFIASHIKGSSLHILKGEGHDSYIVHSEKIARLIKESCKNVS